MTPRARLAQQISQAAHEVQAQQQQRAHLAAAIAHDALLAAAYEQGRSDTRAAMAATLSTWRDSIPPHDAARDVLETIIQSLALA